jgi:endonuclease YncB( thermonuclease family)
MSLCNCIQYLFNNKIKLKDIEPDTIDYFTFNNLVFDAKPCNIYDGDTFSAIFEYKGEYIKYRCRCLGYDTPEMKPLLSKVNRSEEITLAKIAKERFTQLLNKGPNGLVKIKCYGFDKYGRILVTVYNNIDTESINDIMLNENYGKPYDGGRKNPY